MKGFIREDGTYNEFNFTTIRRKPIEDIGKYLNEYLLYRPDSEVYVGVDSKVKSTHTLYAIVIGIRNPGKGVHMIICEKKGAKYGKKDVERKLQQEIQYAVEVGVILNKLIERKVTIHVDINPKPEHRSFRTKGYAKGYLEGTGLPYALKPDSFMAMRAADYITYTDRY